MRPAAEIQLTQAPDCFLRGGDSSENMIRQRCRLQGPPACSLCRGSGIVPTRDGPISLLVEEAGVFCICSVGSALWLAVLNAARE